jgi:hypothetical protein
MNEYLIKFVAVYNLGAGVWVPGAPFRHFPFIITPIVQNSSSVRQAKGWPTEGSEFDSR